MEIFGAVTGLLYVWLEIKQKPVMWVIGFVSSLVYVVVNIQYKVYGYAALNVYYAAVSIYGWYCWRYARQAGSAETGLQISRIRIQSALALVAISAVLYLGCGFALQRFTDSPIPFYDALGTSLSIVATWMLARKILEHWTLWIFINFFSAALYFHRELYPTTVLFIVCGIMSVVGWLKWKQSIEKEK